MNHYTVIHASLYELQSIPMLEKTFYHMQTQQELRS